MNTYNIELTAAQINIIVAGLLELPGKVGLPILDHLRASTDAIDRERASKEKQP